MSETADPWAKYLTPPPSTPAAGDDPWAKYLTPPTEAPQPQLKPGDIDPITRQPVQFMGAPTGQVAEVGTPSPPATGVVTQALSGFAGDEDQRRRILARQVAPDMPFEEATRRMFTIDGRLAMLGQDNQARFLDPEPIAGVTSGPVRTWRGTGLANVAQNIASGLGAVPATAGAIAGGMLAAPTSFLAGPAAAGAGAGAGDVLRQYIARVLDPKDTGKSIYNPLPDNLVQTATEAALGAGGQFLGAAANRALGAANPLALRNQDVRRIQQPGVVDAAKEAIENARAQGVDLSLGQATGNPGLIGMEDVLYRTPAVPGSQDVAGQFYQRQRDAVQQAGRSMLEGISPEPNKTMAALQFAEGARAAVPEARLAGNQAARPAYEIAENAQPVRLGDLAARPAVRSALDTAAVQHMDEFGAPAPSVPGFRMWDNVKKILDDRISSAQREGAYNESRRLTKLRGELVGRLDDIYPTYPEARALAAPGQRLSGALERTAAGRTADAGIDERAASIVAPIFRESNPQYVGMAREAFIKSGNEDAWNAGLRAHTQDIIDKTSRGMEGLNPAFLRRELIGNPDNREVFRAALSPQQFAGLERFADMVTNVARTPALNSMTNPREVTARVLMDQAEPIEAKLVKGLGAALSPSVLNTFKNLGSHMAERMTQRNAGKIADMLFDRDGLRFLEAMAEVPLGIQQGVNAKAQLTARALLGGQGGTLPFVGPTTSQPAPLPLR